MNKRMPKSLIFAAFYGVSCAVLSAQEAPANTYAPEQYETERYRHLWEKSPFVTEKPVVTEKSGGLAQRFVLTGVASMQDQPIIFVLDRQSLARVTVTNEPNQMGLSLVSVQPNNDPKQSLATIRLGAEEGIIRYDLAALESVNKTSESGEPRPPVVSSPSAPPPAEARPANAQTNTNMPPLPARTIRRPRAINLNN